MPKLERDELHGEASVFGRIALLLLSAWLLVMPRVARADAPEFSIQIDDGPLLAGLRSLERQTGIELLYDGDLVRELRSPPVAGKLTTEAALRQMLSEADLAVRRTTSGAWIIEKKEAAPLEQPDAAVSEILVVGRRTQNAEIRRFEDDIQPYTVATKAEIVSAHRDDVDQFISSRITSNTTAIPALASQDGRVMSSISLRGLDSLDTVVLVDGRRMPSIPNVDTGFRQTDLNAIPLHAIERIEVLTGAAGGIHGFGALGGVVNIVLDREVDGFELHTGQGISSRGDARRHSVEAKFGRSFRDGATDFMVLASHQELDTLRVADRDYALRDYRRTYELAPGYRPVYFPHGNSLTVLGLFGDDLTFKPEFGGGELGSSFSYLPIGFSGDSAALVSALQQHAGEVDFSLAEIEGRTDLGSNPQSSSLFANLRHEFGSNWEAYADVILLRNRGESIGPFLVGFEMSMGELTHGSALMSPDSPANPFTDYISVSYPIQDLHGRAAIRLENSRYTAGLEGSLPLGWRGTVETGWGSMRYTTLMSDAFAPLGLSFILFGDESDLETNPLGDWDTFDSVVKDFVMRTSLEEVAETRFHTQSIRLAGPLFETRAGPTTLTLLAERRSEHVPPSHETLITDVDGTVLVNEFRDDPLTRRTRSFYGELRSRLFDESARVPLIRGLEVQLAVRRDEQEDDFQRTQILPDAGMLHTRFTGTAYTLGAKVSPARWLMIRGSYATGEQPPPIANLVEMDPSTIGSLVTDPKRGDTDVDPDGVLLLGGNSELKTTRANTLAVGMVITPGGTEGPRFAVDYSRIRRTRDTRSNEISNIIENEDLWPTRVRRAPLTDEDRANGYTVGAIEFLDVRDSNDGMMNADVFDLHADWPLNVFDGRLRLYADATYQKSNVRSTQYEQALQWAGYLQGPLKRRGNVGFDWSRNQWSLGANAQYFSSSLIYNRNSVQGLFDEVDLLLQGSSRIPSQTYLDLYGSWRLPARNLGSVDGVTLDLGIVNVFDKAPPREHYYLNRGPSYSRYGDTRQRRFELGLSCQF